MYYDRCMTSVATPLAEVDDLDAPVWQPPAGDEFEIELNEVAGHLNAQHGRLVDLAARILAERLWAIDGIHSPEQFLAWKTGLAPQRAREVVAVAQRADELPTCVDALRRGELSIDQMVAIARRAPSWIDGEILELGRMLNVTQIRRLLAQYPFPDAPSGRDEPTTTTGDAADGTMPPPDTAVEPTAGGGSIEVPLDDGREESPDAVAPLPCAGASGTDRFWSGVGDDGRWRLHAECDALTGMLIDQALAEARDALFNAGQVDVTMIDALRELANRSLDGVGSTDRRDRFRIHVHLDTEGHGRDALGCRLPDAIRRHITCDGLISPTFYADGRPFSIGRAQHIVPLRTRRIVVLRDQGCRVPGCTATHHLEVHHIVHWEDGGPTDTWNLVALCPHHHRLHHRGELGISGNADDPDGLTFTRRNGQVLTSSGARPKPPGAAPPTPAGAYEHPLGERVDMRWIHFRPPWQRHPALQAS